MKTSKSLVLAPAVAAAVSGLIAVPAFASTASPTTDSSDSVELPDNIPTGGPATVNPTDSAEPKSQSSEEASDDADPQAIVEAAEVSQKDIADEKKGIRFSGTGFSP